MENGMKCPVGIVVFVLQGDDDDDGDRARVPAPRTVAP